jgi:hypothetical protein
MTPLPEDDSDPFAGLDLSPEGLRQLAAQLTPQQKADLVTIATARLAQLDELERRRPAPAPPPSPGPAL